MINVLVVEDSTVARDLLVHILNSDPGISIIGMAKTGKEAVEFVSRKRPDVITMDINMPELDGIDATKQIMENFPVPIIIISSYWNPKDVVHSFKALQIGAVSLIEKPFGVNHPRYKEISENIIQTVKLMSEIKVIKRTHVNPIEGGAVSNCSIAQKPVYEEKVKLIGIGASTGGPVVLEKILSNIKNDFKLPIVIVQHILPGFVEGLAEWLNYTAKIPVKISIDGEYLKDGICYLAPDGFHMEIGPDLRVNLSEDEPQFGIRPSVSRLFHSLAVSFGKNSIGILLTGMGKDGAAELRELYDSGAVTIAQNQESSVIHGMPGEAVKLKGAKFVLSPEEIISFLNKYTY